MSLIMTELLIFDVSRLKRRWDRRKPKYKAPFTLKPETRFLSPAQTNISTGSTMKH